MLRLLLVAGLALLLVVSGACAQRPPAGRPSILQAQGDTLRVQLVDALSAEPLADAPVQVWSDNGVRCIRAPCPTGARSWSGRTDAGGWLRLPRTALQAASSVETPAHAGDLIEDSRLAGDGWVAALFPADSTGVGPRPVLLVDGRDRPIANASVEIDYGRVGKVTARTNALGYLLVPFAAVARAPDDTWVVAPGFRRTRLDFAWARRRTVLHRR